MPDSIGTLIGALERSAQDRPDAGLAVFDSRGRRASRRTFPEILAASREAAGRWLALGVAPGDRILVSLQTSWEWLDAWLGAVWAGALPVAAAPGPPLGASAAHLERLGALVEQLGARHVVVGAALAEAAGAADARLQSTVITPAQLAAAAPLAAAGTGAEPDDLAFLQLTSGSTGRPRAVSIAHAAALHNTLAIDDMLRRGSAGRAREASVSWLPLHHDLGLVTGPLLALATGRETVLLPPSTFLARPESWLREIAARPGTLACAPNFAFQLIVDRVPPDAVAELSLDGWRFALCGAEMVRPDTAQACCEHLAPAGFDRRAFRPCYGLAEATVGVTADQAGEGLRTRAAPEGAGGDLQEIVCVGSPLRETELRVVDPRGGPCPDDTIGEIQIRGPGLFAGYYDDAAATDEVMDGDWLRSGDLGFLHRGELYISGRLKDILIVRGHNFMPHEFEWLAEGLSGGGGALRAGAFAVTRGPAGEEVILAIEIDRRSPGDLAGLEAAVRDRIGRALAVPVSDIVFVARGGLPRTTSGKVRRRELRRLYLDDRLPAIR